MPNGKMGLLLLLPGLYLLAIGPHLWWSPRSFVRMHTLPFYPPRIKRGIAAITAHERASRRVGAAATVLGVVYLAGVLLRRQSTT